MSHDWERLAVQVVSDAKVQPGVQEANLRSKISNHPAHSELYCDLGSLLLASKRPEEAVVYLRQAVRLSENFLDAYNSLGLALLALGRTEEAADAFERCLSISPLWPPGHVNLATAFKEYGRIGEAIAEYEYAVSLDPESASAHWNLSLALLQAGEFDRGFAEYEWRWRRAQSSPRAFSQPRWDGAPSLSGKTLLLHSEQGLGDTVQFIRFARIIKERSAAERIVFECPSPLKEVLSGVQGVDVLVCESDALPPFDAHLPLMSSPHVLKTTLGTVPADTPYVHVNPERMARVRSILNSGCRGGVNVGLVWQGNPHHQLDRFRSLPLAALGPLAKIPNVRLHSLQRGPGTEQLDDPANRRMGIAEAFGRSDRPGSDEWADTAALTSCMDLVISVDTAPAHLAGALGIPVCILLAKSSDWRWLTGRPDTPWYPTARLFRQHALGNWETVILQVVSELQGLTRSPPLPAQH